MILINIFKNKKNIKLFMSIFFLVSFFYFIFKNLFSSIKVFQINIFSIGEKINLFFRSFFDISELKNIWMLILVLLFIFSISVFLLFSYLLFKESKKISKRHSVWSTFWTFITILGLSCVSCGIGLLASILSALGLSSLVVVFPLHGLELGYLGVLALNISNYFLLKRIKNPFTC